MADVGVGNDSDDTGAVGMNIIQTLSNGIVWVPEPVVDCVGAANNTKNVSGVSVSVAQLWRQIRATGGRMIVPIGRS
jgi:hypothetical protein